jgi:mono/diheme cytochrome c family protein
VIRWWRRAIGSLLFLMAPLTFVDCSPDPDGQVLYKAHCARCHGAEGTGDPRSVGLFPGLNLRTAQPVQAHAHSVVYRTIAQGYGAMPGFSHKLSLEEIEAVVSYLDHFASPRGRH